MNRTCDVRQKPRDGDEEDQRGLGQWVNKVSRPCASRIVKDVRAHIYLVSLPKQRNEKKKFDKDCSGSLTPLRIELLESIGFTWAKVSVRIRGIQ